MEAFVVQNGRLVWCIIVFFLFPLLILTLRKWDGHLAKKKSSLHNSLRIVATWVLPILMIDLFQVKVLGLHVNTLSVKITDTFLWIFITVAALNFFNNTLVGRYIFTKADKTPKLVRDIIQFLLVLLATAFILSIIWELDLGNVIAALGVSSLILGLALQDTLGNLFQGISLLYARPFEKGDWVQIGEHIGRITEINWRSVKILNRNQEMVVIPNGKVGKEIVKNFDRPRKLHAVICEIGFSYDDNPENVKRVLRRLALETEGILREPEPDVYTLSYEDFYINYGIRIFIEDYQRFISVQDRFMTALWKMAKEENLTIPFPIREVLLKKA